MAPTPANKPVRRARVTGGSGDIGAAICHELAAQGCAVHVHAHANAQRARDVVDAIRSAGGEAHAIAFDLTDGAVPARRSKVAR
jgi:3-oxoacyl-[acyl-carrier protein] reductase